MDDNIYDKYFLEQVGNGISSFYSGKRYQNRNGFFGNVLKFLKPALKYISRQGLIATSNLTNSLAKGENFTDAATNQLIDSSKQIMNDGISKLNNYKRKQNGKGYNNKRKKRRKNSRKKLKKKPLKSKRKIVKKKKYKRRKRNKLSTDFL